jgi:undecaprenyl-diphosphatase
MFLAGGLIFGVLAYILRTDDALLQWDMTMAKTFRATQINAPWTLMEDILFGLFIGKQVAILIGTILALYFFHKRFWRELTMTGIGLGGALLWFALSRYFHRPRPADHLDVLQLTGPSFPSGSAVMAILCYGLLAYLLVPNLPSRFWSRVYAGGTFLSGRNARASETPSKGDHVPGSSNTRIVQKVSNAWPGPDPAGQPELCSPCL